MSSRKRNAVTGAVVLIALGILTWMILTFSGRAMGLLKRKGTPVVFVADRGDGLSDGSPVLYKGVQVGKVLGVHFDPKDAQHVKIDGEITFQPLPQNLVGQIRAQSQLGSSTLIDLKTDGIPAGQMERDQRIPIRYLGNSIVPPELTELIDQARRQELVKHTDEAIVSLRLQIDKAGKVFASVQDMIGDPKLQEDLRTSVANIRSATDRANKISGNLDTLTANANVTISKTNENVDKVSRQLGADLDKLGRVFDQFEEVSEKINKGKGTAGQLVNDPKLYDELTATAKELKVVAKSLTRLVDQWEKEGLSVKMGK